MTRTGHNPDAAMAGWRYYHNRGPRMSQFVDRVKEKIPVKQTTGSFHKMVNLAGISLFVGLTMGCMQGGFAAYKPDPKFVDLYAELKLASLALNQDLDKSSEIRRVILAQHGMTPAEFHEHFMQLTDHPEAWKAFQEGVVARIDTYQQKPEVNPEGAKNGK